MSEAVSEQTEEEIRNDAALGDMTEGGANAEFDADHIEVIQRPDSALERMTAVEDHEVVAGETIHEDGTNTVENVLNNLAAPSDIEDAINAEFTDAYEMHAVADDAQGQPMQEAAEPAPDPEAAINEDLAADILKSSVDQTLKQETEARSFIVDFTKHFHEDLYNAIINKQIDGYEDGYYTKPAFRTRFGMVIPGCSKRPTVACYKLNRTWTDTFLSYAYSKSSSIDYFEALFDETYSEKEDAAIKKTINESDFINQEDPFTIKLPFANKSDESIDCFYWIPDEVTREKEPILKKDNGYTTLSELSERAMQGEVDRHYFGKLLPEIKFEREVITPELLVFGLHRNSSKFVYYKIKNTMTGEEFFEITGDREDIANVSQFFKDILKDDSIKFQKTYRYLASQFIKNNWWHPSLKHLLEVDENSIPNPEKIFTPNMSKNLTEDEYKKALVELQRIKSELIPSDSTLAIASPFFMPRPEKETPFKSKYNRDDAELTYLTDFLEEKFLVSSLSDHSINSDAYGFFGLSDEEIAEELSCGLMSDDQLASSRKLLDIQLPLQKATIILKTLELK